MFAQINNAPKIRSNHDILAQHIVIYHIHLKINFRCSRMKKIDLHVQLQLYKSLIFFISTKFLIIYSIYSHSAIPNKKNLNMHSEFFEISFLFCYILLERGDKPYWSCTKIKPSQRCLGFRNQVFFFDHDNQ